MNRRIWIKPYEEGTEDEEDSAVLLPPSAEKESKSINLYSVITPAEELEDQGYVLNEGDTILVESGMVEEFRFEFKGEEHVLLTILSNYVIGEVLSD